MKILVTAGATMAMIDKVRAITNIFKGKTGAAIAYEAAYRNHKVVLLTSNPPHEYQTGPQVRIVRYSTYDQLAELMEREICGFGYDVIVHSAAVSDYKVEGTYYNAANNNFKATQQLVQLDSSKKISSTEKELYLKLVPTEKLIDKIREPWGFKGKLVKFKLQVGISDQELLNIGRDSLIHSKADYLVANCLEWAKEKAYILRRDPDFPENEQWTWEAIGHNKVSRDELASRLIEMLEQEQ